MSTFELCEKLMTSQLYSVECGVNVVVSQMWVACVDSGLMWQLLIPWMQAKVHNTCLTPHASDFVEKQHCFLWPIRRDLPSCSYTTRKSSCLSRRHSDLDTQPRTISTPSDHVTPLHARSHVPRAHSLRFNCPRTNDPNLHKKRFSFAQKIWLPPVYPTNIL